MPGVKLTLRVPGVKLTGVPGVKLTDLRRLGDGGRSSCWVAGVGIREGCFWWDEVEGDGVEDAPLQCKLQAGTR